MSDGAVFLYMKEIAIRKRLNKGVFKLMEKYGYIRVSTKDQKPERQRAAFEKCGIKPENMYLDKVSGKNFERPAYKKMLQVIKKGDVIIIKSIDRLGRNYGEILEQWRFITKDLCVGIEVLDMPLLNTSVCHGDLTGIFVSDIVLQILAYVAETERSFIRQRQAEGIAVAKRQGVRFGCPRKEKPENFIEYYRLWMERRISSREAAEILHMSHTTFYRRCRELMEEVSAG